ncbi:hypothetical protein TASIC1_0001037900 [Trichoderma asperellum]|uniref:Uncharacterized protein n=1 Tax=Trichoderma asperellum TaxID=101201 RepID=A0A6V8QID4_TRIAP|nr:hypothetical protein TASIC1_0001037900 [Trichoderma asperellum]
MGLGLKTGMQFETQPHAAARLIGPGRQPLQPAQRHRGAVPCHPALPPSKSPPEGLQKALPGRGGAAAPAAHQSPLQAAPAVLERTSGFVGLKYGCVASFLRARDEEE